MKQGSDIMGKCYDTKHGGFVIKQRKHRVLLAFVLSVSLMFGGCGKEEVAFEPEPSEFFKMIRDGEIEDISLTIYYMHPTALSLIPIDIESIIATCGAEEFTKYGHGGIVVVEGTELAKYSDLLTVLSTEKLIPLEQDYYMNARIYYVFKDKSERTVLEVVMWGYVRGRTVTAIFVNGLYVENKDIYYDVVTPFLPKEFANAYDKLKPSKG